METFWTGVFEMFRCTFCGGRLEPDTMEEITGVCDDCLERRMDANDFASSVQAWIDSNCKGEAQNEAA